MATLALVCAAGVSGTFLARRIAPSLPDVEFVVTTEQGLDDVIADVDAVLVAAQLAASLDAIRSRVAPKPVELLPAVAMTPAGSILAVDAIDGILQSLAEPTPRSTDV